MASPVFETTLPVARLRSPARGTMVLLTTLTVSGVGSAVGSAGHSAWYFGVQLLDVYADLP